MDNERNEIIEKFQELQRKAFALTHEERMGICDMGFYNDVIKGYLIAAMQNEGFSSDDIKRASKGLRRAFDEITAGEAAEIYKKTSV